MSATRRCTMQAARNRGLIVVAIVGVIYAPLGWSAVQSTASIRAAAKDFLERRIEPGNASFEIEIGHVDRRLRMHQCESPLEAFVPYGGRRKGRITVGVRCRDTRPWKLFVNATVRMYQEIVVTHRAMAGGTL